MWRLSVTRPPLEIVFLSSTFSALPAGSVDNRAPLSSRCGQCSLATDHDPDHSRAAALIFLSPPSNLTPQNRAPSTSSSTCSSTACDASCCSRCQSCRCLLAPYMALRACPVCRASWLQPFATRFWLQCRHARLRYVFPVPGPLVGW